MNDRSTGSNSQQRLSGQVSANTTQLRHRQTKGAETDMPGLLLPRHTSTPPNTTCGKSRFSRRLTAPAFRATAAKAPRYTLDRFRDRKPRPPRDRKPRSAGGALPPPSTQAPPEQRERPHAAVAGRHRQSVRPALLGQDAPAPIHSRYAVADHLPVAQPLGRSAPASLL